MSRFQNTTQNTVYRQKNNPARCCRRSAPVGQRPRPQATAPVPGSLGQVPFLEATTAVKKSIASTGQPQGTPRITLQPRETAQLCFGLRRVACVLRSLLPMHSPPFHLLLPQSPIAVLNGRVTCALCASGHFRGAIAKTSQGTARKPRAKRCLCPGPWLFYSCPSLPHAGSMQ